MIAISRRLSEKRDGVRCDMEMLVIPTCSQTWSLRAEAFGRAARRVCAQNGCFMATRRWELERTLQHNSRYSTQASL